MIKFLIKRIISLIPVIIIISIMLFSIMKLMPGDPVRYMIPPGVINDQEIYNDLYEAAEKRLGLDKPVFFQYFYFFESSIISIY